MAEQSEVSINKQINDLKVNELKIELEKRGLDKIGVKAVLIERLEKALINEGYDPGTYVFFQNVSSTTTVNSSNNTFEISTQSLTTVNENSSKDLTATCLNEIQDDSIENCNLIIDESSKDVVKDISIDAVDDSIITNTSEVIDSKINNTTNEFIKESEKGSPEVINIADINEDNELKLPICSTNKETLKVIEKSKPIQKTTEQDLAASVWIRGITNTTKAADLKILFSKYGKVLAAKIFTTKNKLSPTCFGYITMVDAASTIVCIQKLNRTNLKGKVITVEKANRSLLPQLNKAAAAATTTTTTTPPLTSNNTSITPITATSKIEPEDSRKSTSPEIIHISPPASKKSINDNNSGISNEQIKNNKNINFSDFSKKAENSEKSKSSNNHPRIISTKSTSSSKMKLRKIEPPTRTERSTSTKKHLNRTSKTVSRCLSTSNRPRAPFHLSSSSHLIPSHSRSVKSSMHSKSINNRIYISSRSTALHRSSANNIRRRAAIRRNQNFSRLSNRLAERPRSPISKSSYSHSYSTQKASQHHSNNSAKMSSWERDEMIRLMRKKDEEYRKKEEELKFQRERERMRFERERLEKEKLEVQQMKLTAQLASAQMAFLPQSSHQSLAVVVPDINNTSSDRNRSSKTSKRSSSRERRSSQHHNSTSSDLTKKRRHTRSKSRSSSRLAYGKNNNSKRDEYRVNKSRYSASLSHNKTSSVNASFERVEPFASHDKSSYGQSYNSNSHNSRYYNSSQNLDSNINKSFSKLNNIYVDNRNRLGSNGRVSSLNRQRSSPSRRSRQDSYLVTGTNYNQSSSRLLNEDISSASYTRTDPSYASRIASTNITNSGNVGGVSADEMFGSSGSTNYYNSGGVSSSRNESSFTSRIGNGSFRDNLMPYHQNTISDDNNHWNSSNRNEYSERSLLSGNNSWNSGNVGGSNDLYNSSNRSTDWYSGFPSTNNQQQNLSTNRYSNTSGHSYQNSSRRY